MTCTARSDARPRARRSFDRSSIDLSDCAETIRTSCSHPIARRSRACYLLPTSRTHEILKVLRVLHALLDEVVRQELDAQTQEYRTAIATLQDATAISSAAIDDLRKTAETIKKAVQAAKAVDQVVQLLAKFAI